MTYSLTAFDAVTGPPDRVTESCVGGDAALDALGKANAAPTVAVMTISFIFIRSPLGPSSL